MKRNLIYFVCPFNSNDEWKKNVDAINQYLHKFNNKKIVTIATGDGLVAPEDVMSRFKDKDIKFYVGQNNPELGEVPHFENALEKVYSLDPKEITFYAHAKGVSPKWNKMSNKKFLINIQIWRNIMYYFCLEDIDLVENIFLCFKMCGAIKYDRPAYRLFSWHFSGTFFWFNNKAVFEKDNYSIIQDRYGVESFPGYHFKSIESFHLFTRIIHKIDFMNMEKSEWQKLLNPYNLKVEDFIK